MLGDLIRKELDRVLIEKVLKAHNEGFYTHKGYQAPNSWKSSGTITMSWTTKNGETIYYRDYGKTWALTREELK